MVGAIPCGRPGQAQGTAPTNLYLTHSSFRIGSEGSETILATCPIAESPSWPLPVGSFGAILLIGLLFVRLSSAVSRLGGHSRCDNAGQQIEWPALLATDSERHRRHLVRSRIGAHRHRQCRRHGLLHPGAGLDGGDDRAGSNLGGTKPTAGAAADSCAGQICTLIVVISLLQRLGV